MNFETQILDMVARRTSAEYNLPMDATLVAATHNVANDWFGFDYDFEDEYAAQEAVCWSLAQRVAERYNLIKAAA